MQENWFSSCNDASRNDDVHKTEQWLTQGKVEVAYIGDVVSKPRTIVAEEPLDKVLYLYLLEGSVRVTLSDAGVRTLASHDILIVFPHRVVTVELTAAANRLMLLALQGEAAVDVSLKLGYWDLMCFAESYGGNFMNEIIERFQTAPTRGRDPHVLSMVEHLLGTIRLRVRNSSGLGEVFDAVQTINRLASGVLTTESAATALCISRSKLNNLFMSGMGMRPGEYIAQIILKRSLSMLYWTKHSIEQVAVKMGFSSASALSVFLRRNIGQTPAEFRKKPIVTVKTQINSSLH